MADPFVAEIRLFPFNFAPRGWAFCNGQLMPISQNTAVFALLGTNYGGDGKATFGLPNLQGRAAMGPGQAPGLSLYELGESGGEAAVALDASELPPHSHELRADSGPADTGSPAASLAVANTNGYGSPQNLVAMAPLGGPPQPHNNRQPYLVVNFCIALQGVFPPRP